VPVVLSAPPAPLAFVPGPARYDRPDAAAVLQRAGVSVYFGSGVLPSPDAAPHLALRVAEVVGHGFDPQLALERLTAGAARLAGVEKETGRLAPGLRADLVIWSDHPFAPGARVERVFIGGQEVYHVDGEETEGTE
jgi:imidazolonepropionase-like amidohydrolase